MIEPKNPAPVSQAIAGLLSGEIQVINLGLDIFAEALHQQGTPVVHVDWQPPAGGDTELADLLSALE